MKSSYCRHDIEVGVAAPHLSVAGIHTDGHITLLRCAALYDDCAVLLWY